MLGLKLNHVSKRGYRSPDALTPYIARGWIILLCCHPHTHHLPFLFRVPRNCPRLYINKKHEETPEVRKEDLRFQVELMGPWEMGLYFKMWNSIADCSD